MREKSEFVYTTFGGWTFRENLRYDSDTIPTRFRNDSTTSPTRIRHDSGTRFRHKDKNCLRRRPSMNGQLTQPPLSVGAISRKATRSTRSLAYAIIAEPATLRIAFWPTLHPSNGSRSSDSSTARLSSASHAASLAWIVPRANATPFT